MGHSRTEKAESRERILDAAARQIRLGGLESIAIGELIIDRAARRAIVAGIDVELRAKEFDLLARMAEAYKKTPDSIKKTIKRARLDLLAQKSREIEMEN